MDWEGERCCWKERMRIFKSAIVQCSVESDLSKRIVAKIRVPLQNSVLQGGKTGTVTHT